MTETLYQKRKTKKFVQINIYSFHVARDRPLDKEVEKVSRLIEIQMNKHGYYKFEW